MLPASLRPAALLPPTELVQPPTPTWKLQQQIDGTGSGGVGGDSSADGGNGPTVPAFIVGRQPPQQQAKWGAFLAGLDGRAVIGASSSRDSEAEDQY